MIRKQTFKMIIAPFLLLIPILIIVSNCMQNGDIYSKIDYKLKSRHFNSDIADIIPYSVIIYNNKTHAISSINEYNAINNDSIDINMNTNETFIISLRTFSTVIYSWKILNTINDNILSLDHESSVGLNPESKKVTYGSGEERQNFYFTTLNSGSQILNFEYNSDSYASTDNFKINLNININ